MPTVTKIDEIARQQSVESSATFNRAYLSLLEAENSINIDDGKENDGLFKYELSKIHILSLIEYSNLGIKEK